MGLAHYRVCASRLGSLCRGREVEMGICDGSILWPTSMAANDVPLASGRMRPVTALLWQTKSTKSVSVLGALQKSLYQHCQN